jgi:hypothetical protein
MPENSKGIFEYIIIVDTLTTCSCYVAFSFFGSHRLSRNLLSVFSFLFLRAIFTEGLKEFEIKLIPARSLEFSPWHWVYEDSTSTKFDTVINRVYVMTIFTGFALRENAENRHRTERHQVLKKVFTKHFVSSYSLKQPQ